MIFARGLFLVGSVLALFGLWRLVAPFIYSSVSPNPSQGIIFLVCGGVMMWIGHQLERRNNGGTDQHE